VAYFFVFHEELEDSLDDDKHHRLEALEALILLLNLS
jgi:hypothetical protein